MENKIPQALQDIQIVFSNYIHEIKACFKEEVRVAVIIRNTTRDNANIVIGDATTEDINLVVNQADSLMQIPGEESKIIKP